MSIIAIWFRPVDKNVSSSPNNYNGKLPFVNNIINYFESLYFRLLDPSKTFILRHHFYQYFDHPYNDSKNNERTVEVPIIWFEVNRYPKNKVLEIGNVLSHYFPIEHDVVDKYEKAEGVINEDIVDFSSEKKYDLIVSISTLEHVGWDETPKDPVKILMAIEHIKNLLSPGGKMIVTLPLGYNTDMDMALEERKIIFDEQYYLKRIDTNRWVAVKWDDLKDTKYGSPFPCANGLVIGIDYNR